MNIPNTGTGILKHGLKIGEKTYLNFKLREPVMADYVAAENDVSPDKEFAFDLALFSQLAEFDGFDGALTVGLLGKLRPADFGIMRRALREVAAAGESELGATPTG